MLDRGELSRRSFMRRMLGAGVGILSLEFIGGSIAFLWPSAKGGLGGVVPIGTLEEIGARFPEWATGRPVELREIGAFLVNVPAATAWATDAPVPQAPPGAADLLALWRKCPHLGCMIPAACEGLGRFQCYCHQSTYNVIGEKLELGPAPRGMDRFSVGLEDGVVVVDTREVVTGPPLGTVTFDDGSPSDVGCL
jgi:cytochrome b6-f complex iron-sulfur subunit